MQRLVSLGLVGVLLMGLLLAAEPAHASTSRQGQGNVTHVVQWGETLFSIARRYGTTVGAICAANGVVNPAHIYAGQQLVIPSSGSSAGSSATSSANPPANAGAAGTTHVVHAGENLYRIALRYGTTVQALAQLNGIPNHHRIVAGQVLRIPEGTVMAAAAAYQPAHTTTTHTVQPGETLSAIALRYGATSWALVRANTITNPALIFPGQILLIPQTNAASSPSSSSTDGAKQIVVDLSEQHLYAYDGATLIYSFVASTGMRSSPTRAGTFHVLDKIPNAYASTCGLQMPYWLGIYWSGGLENGIHALPILSNGQQLWAGYLGTPISYGCVVLGTQEARTLYEWADVGTSVVVQP